MHALKRTKKLKKINVLVTPEAVAQRCSVKKVFLEISQNSQENACDRDFFNKVAGLRLILIQKLLRVSDLCKLLSEV